MEKRQPTPLKRESRNCFGIEWYASEDEAAAAAKGKRGTVNGGYGHGSPTGRAPHFDYSDAAFGRLYAITVP